MSRQSSGVVRLRAWHLGDWLTLIALLGAAAMFVLQCCWVGHAAIDDAFITFSFSKNLALGHGPLYSHGVLAEGYSTFLWMVLVAIPLVLTRGAFPLAAARVMAAPFALLLGWAVFRMARACGASRLTAALCVLLLSLNTDLAVAYLTGMETLPYVAVLAFAFALTVQSLVHGRCHKSAPWAALAVALMRIDGFIPAGFLLGCLFLRDLCQSSRQPLRSSLRSSLRSWIRGVVVTYAPPLAVYALWFLWRWHYYGLLLPSTYYAKSLISTLMPWRGFQYVTDEVIGGWLWLGLVGWCWLLWRRRLGAAMLGSFVIIHWTYVVKAGGDWMPFGRFILPTVPLLIVLLGAAGTDAVVAAFRSKNRLHWLVPCLPLAAGCMMAIHMDHRYLNNALEDGKVGGSAEQTTNVEAYLRAAEFLRQLVPVGGRLVTDYGGVFACYTDGALIEMWGLANATIATRGNTENVTPIYGKTCAACYPDLQPEYFHVVQPMIRKTSALASTDEVIKNVWQTDTIGRYINFRADFVAGRVRRPSTGEALYFLQKRTTVSSLAARSTGDGFIIEYPFDETANGMALDAAKNN